MSSLTPREQEYLEQLFDMGSGYVLHFSDRTIGKFFAEFANIDIHDKKYCKNGTSKAKKLREFWRLEDDYLVGTVVEALIKERQEKLYGNQSNFSASSEETISDEKNQLIAICKDIAKRLLSGQGNLDTLKQTVTDFNSHYLSAQIQRMEQSINDDPELAIGTAKELIETCCKTILAKRGKPVEGTPDIHKLTKDTLKELNLVPEGINNEARGSAVIRVLLSNLGTIPKNLAELRNLYGTGHGKAGQSRGLSPRHAKLAVGAGVTLATFLFDTHQETK